MAASSTGTSTSLIPLPCQRTTEIATDTAPASSRLASSIQANGVAPLAVAVTAELGGAVKSLRLGGGLFL